MFTHTAAGFYIYIETSSPRVSGEKARLESDIAPPTPETCLEFWYHMYGDDIDALNVYAAVDGTGLGIPIWSRVGTKDDAWYQGRVTVTMATAYKVGVVEMEYSS